ncbi:hypothetical protein Scep_026459 [Stephania cephalantha]|uniref:Decapping nuclease n=1 Tax=Stephania cephalantha TaxID=152367 RepID=A0AAP0EK60_9MAGN
MSFLGLPGSYRRFVKDFSKIASPLTRLTQKDVAYEYTEKCEVAFTQLKRSLTTAPVAAVLWHTHREKFLKDYDFSWSITKEKRTELFKFLSYQSLYVSDFNLNKSKQLYTNQLGQPRVWKPHIYSMESRSRVLTINLLVLAPFPYSIADMHSVKHKNNEPSPLELCTHDNKNISKTFIRNFCLFPTSPRGRACVLEFGRSRAEYLLALYGRPCRSPSCWAELEDQEIVGPEIIIDHTEKVFRDLGLTKSSTTLSKVVFAFREIKESRSSNKRIINPRLSSNSKAQGIECIYDRRGFLGLFAFLVHEYCGNELGRGASYYVVADELMNVGRGELVDQYRKQKHPLQNHIHFVTFRNNLNKILATAYIRHEAWEMGVHKRNGVVYLDVHKLPERPQSELDRRRCYWGYCFENLATEDSTRDDGIHHIDANVEFCSVIKTKLGAHRILMGAEMDCCDSTDDGRRFYVELKTSRELDYHTEERFEREKLLKFWIQSFLAGVPYIVVGFRDDSGRLVRTERLRTKDVTHRVKMKNYWQGGVCLAYADEVLCWLYGTVKENEDYILQFSPPFNRLELLKAPSCPDAIASHVDQL